MLNLTPPSGGGTARSIQATELIDFTGGLNLSSDRFKLALNESPDLLNVDVHARGGVEVRGGMTQFSEEDTDLVGRLFTGSWHHRSSDGTEFLTVAVGADADGNAVTRSVDSSGQTLIQGPVFGPTNPDEPDELFGTQMDDVTYITSRRYGPHNMRFNASSQVEWRSMLPAGTNAWNEDEAGNGAGVFPQGRTSAVWDNRMWVASTIEDGVRHRNRVRFSVEGNPEQWREDDWIDVDTGEDGDEITALAKHGEVLVVFKARAVYLIIQRDDGFLYSRVQVSAAVGATNPYAVQSSPFGLWFWDGRSGLYVWNGENPTFAGSRLLQGLEEARIPRESDVTMGWVNNRLWISTELDFKSVNFVFDATLGSFSVYEPSIVAPFLFAGRMVGYSPSLRRWLSVDQRTSVDDFGDGPQSIPSFWVSPHVHGGRHWVKKKFRRPKFTVSATGQADVQVDVFRDYSGSLMRTMLLRLADLRDGEQWGGFDWGNAEWSSGDTNIGSEITQGASLCRAHAVQFKLNGPTQAVRWRLDSLVVPYISLPTRG